MEFKWIDYRSPESYEAISEEGLYLAYAPGHAIQVVIFRTGHGLVNISGGYCLHDITKIAVINPPGKEWCYD